MERDRNGPRTCGLESTQTGSVARSGSPGTTGLQLGGRACLSQATEPWQRGIIRLQKGEARWEGREGRLSIACHTPAPPGSPHPRWRGQEDARTCSGSTSVCLRRDLCVPAWTSQDTERISVTSGRCRLHTDLQPFHLQCLLWPRENMQDCLPHPGFPGQPLPTGCSQGLWFCLTGGQGAPCADGLAVFCGSGPERFRSQIHLLSFLGNFV